MRRGHFRVNAGPPTKGLAAGARRDYLAAMTDFSPSFDHPAWAPPIDARRHAPATQRNRQPILQVLSEVLPTSGTLSSLKR